MADQRQSEFTLRGMGEMIFRHKRKVIICPIVALALGAAVILFCPRTYRSEAELFLRIGRESVGIDPTATAGQTVPLQQFDRKDEIKSAIELFKSRAIISKVVDQLGPDVVLGETDADKPNILVRTLTAPVRILGAIVKSIDPISDRERAIIAIEKNLNADAEREATIILVQYDADSAKLAQTVCSALVDVYLQEHMRIHRNEGSQPFFAEQQKRLQSELDDSLRIVQAAKNEMGLASIESRRTTLEAQFSAIELERLSTKQQLVSSVARSAELEALLAKVPERLVASNKSVPNVGADLLREQLYALQVQSMGLQARYNDSHPMVREVNQQLEDAKKVLAEQTDQRLESSDEVNPIHRQLSLELKQEQGVLAGLKAREEELAQQKETVLADLRTINGSELKLDQLSRQAELARDKFLQYSRNMEEAFIDVALESQKINNVSVVLPATLAERPVSPSKPLVALATLVLAVAGTGALVLGSERLSDKLHTEEDVADALGMPVLGTIPGDPEHDHVLSTPTTGRRQTSTTIESWI